MEGQMQLFFKDGEIRNINLTKAFFDEERISIGSRAQDMAYGFNPFPWKILVFQGGNLKYQKTIERNTPDHILEEQADKSKCNFRRNRRNQYKNAA